MTYLRQTLTLALLTLSLTANASEVLTPGTYKQVQGNCCSIVKVFASNPYTLIVVPGGSCGTMLKTTYNCQDGICTDTTYGDETVAIRSSTSFEDFSDEVGTCKFQLQ